ncbi:MAG TPA: alpha/beta fold hydrolase [Micromonosporaceae bacterium]|jgi:pimeloyl-ACP methyl ester carboxylesterase
MSIVTSADGTTIGYEATGSGPALLLVDGAFCSRSFGPMPALAKRLAPHFTVYTYDRRGRGESGDTLPYAPEREIEDIDAVLEAAGGSAYMHGTSSGSILAARAAAALPGKVTRLALYEPPLLVDSSRPAPPADYLPRIEGMLAAGRNGDVIKFFMVTMVGAPAFVPYLIRVLPPWKKLTAAAPTLPYDLTILGDTQTGTGLPDELVKVLSSIDVPVWVGDGGKSPEWMHNGVQAAADRIPGSQRATLAGQNHQVKAAAIAPALIEFFGS